MRLGLLLAIVAGATLWWQTRPVRERQRAIESQDFRQSEPLLHKTLARNPQDLEVIRILARGYAATEDPRAAEYLDRWLRLQPRDPEGLRLQWNLYRHTIHREKAYECGRTLLELEPGDFDLRRGVMSKAFSIGCFDEAETLCRQCLEAKPGDTGLCTMLAEILRARGEPKASAAVLDQLLAEKPELIPAMFSRAVLHDEAGEPEKAIPLLRKVVQRDPSRSRTAGYQLGMILERTGHHEEARAVLAEVKRQQDVLNADDAVRNSPADVPLHVRVGEELLAAGHTSDGIRFLEKALEIDPACLPAHKALAAAYKKNGQDDLARIHRKLAGLE
jgi:tetratricopeptide (TPR) repeat protein